MIELCKKFLFIASLFLNRNLKRSRKPFKLNGILMPYNLAMAILNAFIFYRLGEGALRLNYSIYCEPCRQVSTKYEMQVSATNDLTLTALFWSFCFICITISEIDHWSAMTLLTCVPSSGGKCVEWFVIEIDTSYAIQTLFLRLIGL